MMNENQESENGNAIGNVHDQLRETFFPSLIVQHFPEGFWEVVDEVGGD